MALPARIELATPSLEGWCSVQLSYRSKNGGCGGDRTHDPEIKSFVLLPTELHTQYQITPDERQQEKQDYRFSSKDYTCYS